MIKSDDCIGCQACADMCPSKAIDFLYNEWGEGHAFADADRCLNCGLCDKICPSNNKIVNTKQKTVFAVVSKRNHKTGSSGGVFYELAKRFIEKGGVVIGASFSLDLRVIHSYATRIEELSPLCKSKYIHSDMKGAYSMMKELLSSGASIMYVGTPCQVSAVKNLFYDKYAEKLLLIDFLCHGSGTQKVFDACVREEERRMNGEITSFQFRAKSRKAEHSFTYSMKCGDKGKIVSGYAFEFPYYNSYLEYTIFCDVCYSCDYSQNNRVGDITLGDFWGIEKYNKRLSAKRGVSMVSVNSENGKRSFDELRECCRVMEYPIEYASSNNQSFNMAEPFPARKAELYATLIERGESALVREMSCKSIRKTIIYSKMPKWAIKLYNKIRGR